jgi:hypothetical protein
MVFLMFVLLVWCRTAMKRLVATMGALEMYQQNVWKDCLQAMNDVKLQTREAKRRAVGVRDRLDKLIPKGEWLNGCDVLCRFRPLCFVFC